MKKGFTLIELLAVITVLGMILLISTIAVTKTISNSKKNTLKIQQSEILKSAEEYYIKEGSFNNQDNFCINIEELSDSGYIDSKKIIDPTTKKQMIGSVKINIDNGKVNYKYVDKACEKTCFPVDDGTVKIGNVPSGDFNTGDEYICNVDGTNSLHFLIVGVEEGDRINLILDHNLEKRQFLNDSSADSIVELDTSNSPALQLLYEKTKNWTGVQTPKFYDSSMLKQYLELLEASGKSVAWENFIDYSIDYSNFKAKLLEVEFHDVFEFSDEYWTSAMLKVAALYVNSSNEGDVKELTAVSGVRPVITVLKSDFEK